MHGESRNGREEGLAWRWAGTMIRFGAIRLKSKMTN